MSKRYRLALVLEVALLMACGLPAVLATPTTTAPTRPPATAVVGLSAAPATPTPTPAPTATLEPTAAPPEHVLGVRVVDGVGEFYDRRTGVRFVPRGMNYIRLALQTKLDGASIFGHALFDPGRYDSAQVSADLEKMHADGYNVVRVFLSPDTLGSASGGLSPAYLANIVDLLQRAQQHAIYVMFTQDWLPGGQYDEILSHDCCTTFALMNAHFLPPSGLQANQAFFQDFIRALLALNAPTDQIFSYQLRNEMFYDTDQPPLSLSSGLVHTANGQTYDLADPAAKLAMVTDNNVYWIDAVRAAILAVDPSALVSVGFFVPQAPNPARIDDPRLVVSAPALWQSQADFIDLHAYAGFELNLQQIVENFGVDNQQVKPMVMGEFGGEVSRFPSLQAAALAFRDWQVESCRYGFDGWIFWTWDLDEQPDFFNALMQHGAINGVLAPVVRPDPCLP